MSKHHPQQIKHPALEAALLSFRRAMNTRLVSEAKEYSLGLSHFEAMTFIAEREKTSLKELAEFLSITPPSASVLVDSLVSKKMLKRRVVLGNRRKISISLGEGAQKLFLKLSGRKHSFFESMISKLSDRDKEELARILTKCAS